MDFKQFILSLTIIHLALIMGICLVCLVLFFVTQGQETMDSGLPFNDNFLIILAAIPWFGSRLIYRSGITKSLDIQDLTNKLMQYRKTLILSLAISEGITMLSIILYFFVVPSSMLLFVIATGVISMFLLRPSEARIVAELQLSAKEEKELKGLVIPRS